jgi:hypothetical protein
MEGGGTEALMRIFLNGAQKNAFPQCHFVAGADNGPALISWRMGDE